MRDERGRCEHSEESAPLHVCPFKAEIYDDTETLCRCCDDCQYECAMDI